MEKLKVMDEVREPALKLELRNHLSIDKRSRSSMMRVVRDGISFDSFEEILTKYPFTLEEWSSFLHISERTIQRYRKDSKPFDTLQSEKILQITFLYERGVEVFGSQDKFNLWLKTPSLALGRVQPKELLDNVFGITLLEEELGRIEHGILA